MNNESKEFGHETGAANNTSSPWTDYTTLLKVYNLIYDEERKLNVNKFAKEKLKYLEYEVSLCKKVIELTNVSYVNNGDIPENIDKESFDKYIPTFPGVERLNELLTRAR